MRLSRTLLGTLALLVSLAGPAGANVDAGKAPFGEPKTEGPLSLESSQCSDQPVKAGSGAVLGSAETCVYVYSFDTLSEVDVLREYGAVWLQAQFVPAAGWCVTDVGTKLEVDGGRSEGVAKISKGPKPSTTLTLNAGGDALEKASITQKWPAATGAISTGENDEAPGVTSTWKGNSSKAVNLVSGAGYSYEMLDGPPDNVSFGFSNFSLVTC